MDKPDKRLERRVAFGAMGRSPFATLILAQAGMMAAIAPGEPQIMLRQKPPAEPKPEPAPEPAPRTQRLRMVDEAGIEQINLAKARNNRRNAKRLRDFERQKR